jgi:hypothetical protein
MLNLFCTFKWKNVWPFLRTCYTQRRVILSNAEGGWVTPRAGAARRKHPQRAGLQGIYKAPEPRYGSAAHHRTRHQHSARRVPDVQRSCSIPARASSVLGSECSARSSGLSQATCAQLWRDAAGHPQRPHCINFVHTLYKFDTAYRINLYKVVQSLYYVAAGDQPRHPGAVAFAWEPCRDKTLVSVGQFRDISTHHRS